MNTVLALFVCFTVPGQVIDKIRYQGYQVPDRLQDLRGAPKKKKGQKKGRVVYKYVFGLLYEVFPIYRRIVLYVLYLNLVYSHLPAVANTPPPRVWIMRGDSLSPNWHEY